MQHEPADPDPVELPEAVETVGLIAPGMGGAARLERLIVAPPQAGQVRVRVLASGICHTDLLMTQGRSWWPDYPYVLGHEGCGIVESVGPGIDTGRVGEMVLLAWKTPCGTCRFCTAGRDWLCSDPPRAHGRLQLGDGTPVAPALRVGSHAGFAVVPSGSAIPLPPGLSPEVACLLGCAVLTGVGAATRTAGVQRGQRVAVFGAGGVGLSIIAGARIAGASMIIAADPSPAKLAVAATMGATNTLAGRSSEVLDEIGRLTAGYGVDHAFDAVGRGGVVVDALRCLDSGGICTLVGTPDVTDIAPVPLELLYLKRLGLRVSQYGDVVPSRDGPELAARCSRGELDLRPLVTRVVRLADAVAGLEALHDGETVRTVIRFESDGGAG